MLTDAGIFIYAAFELVVLDLIASFDVCTEYLSFTSFVTQDKRLSRYCESIFCSNCHPYGFRPFRKADSNRPNDLPAGRIND